MNRRAPIAAAVGTATFVSAGLIANAGVLVSPRLAVVGGALAGLLRLLRDGGAAWRASLPLAPFFAAGALIAVIT
jgi:prepilin signal peptidase PulO-like enzyme (type II secretory pathway)